jgi:hypothetical protein
MFSLHKRLQVIGGVNIHRFKSIKINCQIKNFLRKFRQFFDLVSELPRVIRNINLRDKIQDLDRFFIKIVFRYYVERSDKMENPIYHN